MKKARFFFLLVLLLTLNTTKSVLASPADYLPAGTNYLNIDNFSYSDEWFHSIDPFAIKPDTDFVLTIDDHYWQTLRDPEMPTILISVYDNDILVQEEEFTFYDFVESSNDELAYSVTFHTVVSGNHIEIQFYDFESYFETNGFNRTMLEEGNEFTTFEPYVQGTLLDTASPEFNTINQVISYVHQPISVEDIALSLEAYDTIDGDVSSSIIITEDLYTPNKTVLGDYTVSFAVSDSAGNTTEAVINVKVVDVLKPEFSSIEMITLPYPQTLSIADIQSLLQASDNYDGDITEDIYIIEDSYSLSASLIGVYRITFGVEDSSGNLSTLDVYVTVTDDTAPIISGTNSIIIGYDEMISISSIQNALTVIDNYDGDLSLLVESDDYTENHSTIGEYSIVFLAEDSSGNKTSYTVTVQVVDEIGPILYYDYLIVQTYQNYVLSLEDFIHLLSLSEELGNIDHASVSVLYDSYTAFASTPGVYHLKLLINDEIQKDFEINVKESSDYIYLPMEDDTSFFKENIKVIEIFSAALVLILSTTMAFIHFKKK
ncbi:MAG: Ig-like domain repeat protein [Candidatus Izemoplasmatales bacterium]